VSTALAMAAIPTTTGRAVTPATLTIDELASQTKVPSRTIRFYQSKGALMAPTIQGRVAHYGPAHIERLRLIAQLQDRGLTVDAIRDLCQRLDAGELDLAEWLGVERELAAPWADDGSRALSEAQLAELIGSPRPGLVAELIRVRLIERRDQLFLVPSPAMLGAALKLEAAGVPLPVSAEIGQKLGKHMERTAADLASLFVKRLEEGAIEGAMSPKLLNTLRPTAIDAVRVLFGREMEKQLRQLLESGRIAKKLGRGKKPR
jgi:DNA-binding transcriptional MerR regulator